MRGAWGLADREAKKPATPDTVYRLGSTSKQFTAVLVLRLACCWRFRISSRASPSSRRSSESSFRCAKSRSHTSCVSKASVIVRMRGTSAGSCLGSGASRVSHRDEHLAQL